MEDLIKDLDKPKSKKSTKEDKYKVHPQFKVHKQLTTSISPDGEIINLLGEKVVVQKSKAHCCGGDPVTWEEEIRGATQKDLAFYYDWQEKQKVAAKIVIKA